MHPPTALTRRRHLLQLARLALLSLLVVVAAGCGGGGGATSAAGPTSTPAAPVNPTTPSNLPPTGGVPDTPAPEPGPQILNLYVSPDGDDTATGLAASASGVDGPLRSLPAAQARARQHLAAMATGGNRQPVVVNIASGTYRLSSPLQFGPADSGTEAAPVAWQATVPGSVFISGARRVGTALAGAQGSVVDLSLPAVATPADAQGPALDPTAPGLAPQLYVNGRRATLARTPDAGQYWFVRRAWPLPEEPAGSAGREAFEPPLEALAFVQSLPAAERQRAVLRLMQGWSAGHHRLTTMAPAGALRVQPRTLWPFLNFGSDQRFFVENVTAAFDAPGEWLWADGRLRYRRSADDANEALTFELPQLEQLLLVRGSQGALVQDLEFRGLGFVHTRWLTPVEGWTDDQAAATVGAAIEVNHAQRIVFSNCSVRHTGGYALWLREGVRDSRIEGCQLQDLGAGGVKLGLTAQDPTDTTASGHNTVNANRITGTGRLIPGAVGVWVGQSSDNTISHNLVADTTYSGISVGWRWTYGAATAARNQIVANLLLNVGRGELSDMGAIYTLGESPGTVISGNVIHQVWSYPRYGAGGWGLYNDEASSGIVLENNIVVGSEGGGYMLHHGRGNTVRRNLLAQGERSEVRVTRSDPATALDFHDNLLMPAALQPFAGFATAPDVLYTSNAVSSELMPSGRADVTRCGNGCSPSAAMLTVGADPRSITLTGADTATQAWVGAVTAAVGPPGLSAADIPPLVRGRPAVALAPPLPFVADIAGAAAGALPLNLRGVVGGGLARLGVQPDSGSPLGRCLRFDDAADTAHPWEPFAYATLGHAQGSSQATLQLRIDASTVLRHEWRDDGLSFLTGPSVRITPAGIEAAGRVVAPAPVGEWFTLQVTAALGDAAGSWTLDVSYANGQRVSAGPFASKNPGWQRLNWMGLSSEASSPSSPCLGGLEVQNSGGS
jgi:hypothetical protein